MATYAEKLKDPRWQKKRLAIFDRDHFRCQLCDNDKETLCVHHKKYISGKNPWDYEDRLLITLCESCHEKFHSEPLPKKGTISSWEVNKLIKKHPIPVFNMDGVGNFLGLYLKQIKWTKKEAFESYKRTKYRIVSESEFQILISNPEDKQNLQADNTPLIKAAIEHFLDCGIKSVLIEDYTESPKPPSLISQPSETPASTLSKIRQQVLNRKKAENGK